MINHYLANDEIINSVSAYLLSYFPIKSVIDHWLKQTLCVIYLLSWFWVDLIFHKVVMHTICIRYCTELVFSSFGNLPMIDAETLWYLLYWVDFRFNCNLPILNQILCVIYFTKLILGSRGNWSVIKSGTLS